MRSVYTSSLLNYRRIIPYRRDLHIQDRQSEHLKRKFDVVVVGGGHAGIESAAAASRCGARTLMITLKIDTIGVMSCNPSFGGIGKGHLVREIDAFDGVCGRICDQSAISYHALNRSHGPAVLGLRAQIERHRYPQLVQDEIVNRTPNLYVLEASVDDLVIEKGVNSDRIGGCILEDGTVIKSHAVIITTGTFLSAEMFCGTTSIAGGRRGEKASYALAETFKRLGLDLKRHRTGTPPRVSAKSIDFSKFKPVPPDEKPIPFSFMTEQIWMQVDRQIPSYIGHTNENVAKVILDNVKNNRYYIGSEVSRPRYCPSLESKIVRFPNLKHRLYLEREGIDSDTIYMQGCGLNFDPKIQSDIIRAIPGLEKAELLLPGYGVAYDHVNPRQLRPDLSVIKLPGLYLAGQINGSTGYEEAGSQGIVAGINAAWLANSRKGIKQADEPLKLDRSEGYTGVLIDDLTSLGTNEPYRMFTSRVEFRLHLRADNADLRLTEIGRKYGAVSDARYSKFSKIRQNFDTCKTLLQDIRMSLQEWNRYISKIAPALKSKTAYQMLGENGISLRELYASIPDKLHEIRDVIEDEDLEMRLKNDSFYMIHQQRLIQKMDEVRNEINASLPEEINYLQMNSLNLECREKLDQYRPANLAAASRIPGITPEALINLLRYVKTSEQTSRL